MPRFRAALIWGLLALVIIWPLFVAARSPLLAWRDGVYIAAGFAGIVAMALVLIQPLLAGAYLPGIALRESRLLHRWVGLLLVVALVLHVAGLWITSAPDVIDALLFASPTPFSVWGVLAMWAVFAGALVGLLRRRLHIRPKLWRGIHLALAMLIVIGGIIHALLIEGTMGTLSKLALCVAVFAAMARLLVDLRPRPRSPQR